MCIDLATRLRVVISERKRKRGVVARDARLPPMLYRRYERGESPSIEDTVRDNAEALDLTLDYITGITEIAEVDQRIVKLLQEIEKLLPIQRQILTDMVVAILKELKNSSADA